QGDFLRPAIEKGINPFIVVSNPPYISEHEKITLADTVKNFDPSLALFAENDGLGAYEKILQQIFFLPENNNRTVCFEIGFSQAFDVSTLIKKYFSASIVDTIKDINGNDRIVSAYLKE